MSRITSNIGLITGIPIAETVNQLVAVQARPRDLLVQKTEKIQREQVALSEISALLLSLQFTARNLTKPALFTKHTASSSNPQALSATITGSTAAAGVYQFTPLHAAQSHQLLSTGVARADQPLGAGALSLRFGGYIDAGIALSDLGGGAGFQPGKIRITDRSGASAIIDLRYARTIDDVLAAINGNEQIQVEALAVGDALRLVDRSGQTLSNLRVQEVGGQTASSLGLAGIDVAADTADGTDILRLHTGTSLHRLRDGNGLDILDSLPDFTITFRDGTTRQVDLHPLSNATLYADATTTAANGNSAQVRFTAAQAGSSLAGVQIVFEHDPNVVAGAETVAYDAQTKTLRFGIEQGATTASHIVAALNGDATASGYFTAALSAGSDGSGLIDPSDTATTSLPAAVAEQTLGDLLAALNRVAPSKLRAELSADGDRLVLTDLTSGAGTFSIAADFGSRVAQQLGIEGSATGGVLTGARLLGGLRSRLVQTLDGGRGFTLGVLGITDRAGMHADVDLSAAETLDDIIAAINAAGIGVQAQVNNARNGLLLRDTSGGTGPLQVTNGDATNTADLLQLAVDAAVSQIDSGDLRPQVVGRPTSLAALRGGAGIQRGSFRIVDSLGRSTTINLSSESIQTIGDVIDEIRRLAPGVTARINDRGDGILLIDTAGGNGTMQVVESGGRTAADLRLAGTAVEALVDNQLRQVIDGSTTYTFQVDADDTLHDLAAAINASDLGVAASVFNDGSPQNPYRLVLSSQRSGTAGALRVDASQLALSFHQSVAPRDALLLLGSPSDSAAGVVLASSSGQFSDVVPGVRLQVQQPSTTAATVTVTRSDTDVVAGVQALVDSYNRLIAKIREHTRFDPKTGTKGALQGDLNVLRVESDLSRLLSGRFVSSGTLQALESLGIRFEQDGKLSLDTATLKAQFADNPQAVESLLAGEGTGFGQRLDALLEQMAGESSSLLASRLQALDRKIQDNQERIEFLNERLQRYRDTLLLKFFKLEEAIARIQSNLNAIQNLTPLQPLPPRR
jgi:flagellar hook-associated protein 2